MSHDAARIHDGGGGGIEQHENEENEDVEEVDAGDGGVRTENARNRDEEEDGEAKGKGKVEGETRPGHARAGWADVDTNETYGGGNGFPSSVASQAQTQAQGQAQAQARGQAQEHEHEQEQSEDTTTTPTQQSMTPHAPAGPRPPRPGSRSRPASSGGAWSGRKAKGGVGARSGAEEGADAGVGTGSTGDGVRSAPSLAEDGACGAQRGRERVGGGADDPVDGRGGTNQQHSTTNSTTTSGGILATPVAVPAHAPVSVVRAAVVTPTSASVSAVSAPGAQTTAPARGTTSSLSSAIASDAAVLATSSDADMPARVHRSQVALPQLAHVSAPPPPAPLPLPPAPAHVPLASHSPATPASPAIPHSSVSVRGLDSRDSSDPSMWHDALSSSFSSPSTPRFKPSFLGNSGPAGTGVLSGSQTMHDGWSGTRSPTNGIGSTSVDGTASEIGIAWSASALGSATGTGVGSGYGDGGLRDPRDVDWRREAIVKAAEKSGSVGFGGGMGGGVGVSGGVVGSAGTGSARGSGVLSGASTATSGPTGLKPADPSPLLASLCRALAIVLADSEDADEDEDDEAEERVGGVGVVGTKSMGGDLQKRTWSAVQDALDKVECAVGSAGGGGDAIIPPPYHFILALLFACISSPFSYSPSPPPMPSPTLLPRLASLTPTNPTPHVILTLLTTPAPAIAHCVLTVLSLPRSLMSSAPLPAHLATAPTPPTSSNTVPHVSALQRALAQPRDATDTWCDVIQWCVGVAAAGSAAVQAGQEQEQGRQQQRRGVPVEGAQRAVQRLVVGMKVVEVLLPRNPPPAPLARTTYPHFHILLALAHAVATPAGTDLAAIAGRCARTVAAAGRGEVRQVYGGPPWAVEIGVGGGAAVELFRAKEQREKEERVQLVRQERGVLLDDDEDDERAPPPPAPRLPPAHFHPAYKPETLAVLERVYMHVDPIVERLAPAGGGGGAAGGQASGTGGDMEEILVSTMWGAMVLTRDEVVWYGREKGGHGKDPRLKEALRLKFSTILRFSTGPCHRAAHVARGVPGRGGIPPGPATRKDQDAGGSQWHHLALFTRREVFRFYPFSDEERDRLVGVVGGLLGCGPVSEKDYVKGILSKKLETLRRQVLHRILTSSVSQPWIDTSADLVNIMKDLTAENKPQSVFDMERLFHSCRLEPEVTKETIYNLRRIWHNTRSEQVRIKVLSIADRLLDKVVMRSNDANFTTIYRWLKHLEETVNPYKSPQSLLIIETLIRRAKYIQIEPLAPLANNAYPAMFDHWDDYCYMVQHTGLVGEF